MRLGQTKAGLLASILLSFAPGASAQQTGELWEITMNMPGMPAGMMKPQRVCQGDDPSRAATQDPSKKDCKITGTKKTALGTTVVMSCPDGSTMTIEQQFTSAARTEFKSTMTSKGGRQGEFTMNMTGRKVGTCDAVAENKARDEKIASMKKQAAAGTAAGAAAVKDASDKQIAQCTAAAEKMEYTGLGIGGQCYAKKDDKQCQQLAQAYPEVSKACGARAAEFCKRLQTPSGYMKANNRENAAKMCGVSAASIKAANCPKGEKIESLAFLGAYCPVEAKPIAEVNCTGRDYTSKQGGKYNAFCSNYLANADFEKPRSGGSAPAASGSVPSGTAPSQNQTQGQKSADAVKEGVSQGINKLRGLFSK